MISDSLRVAWRSYERDFQPLRPGRWGIRIVDVGPANQLGHYLMEHRYEVESIDSTLDLVNRVVSGRYRPGWVGGDNDGGVAYGNGYFYVASGYSEPDQLVVTADVFRAAFVWLRDLVTHPDFTNPTPVVPFEPFVVEIVAAGVGSDEVYRELGGSFFVETYPSTDHLN